MTPRMFVFDTSDALMVPPVQLPDFKEQPGLDICADSKGFRIFSLRSPLYVRGTFGKPDVGVHVGPLAARRGHGGAGGDSDAGGRPAGVDRAEHQRR